MRTPEIRIALGIGLLAGVAACGAPLSPPPTASTAATGGIDRTVLPIAEPAPQRYTELDARNAKAPERFTIAAPTVLPPGPVTVTLDFVYDGGGAGKGGKATLLVNGKAVAEGRVGKTQPNVFSADETADVGIDNQTPVAQGIGMGAETRFTGRINKVTLDVGPTK